MRRTSSILRSLAAALVLAACGAPDDAGDVDDAPPPADGPRGESVPFRRVSSGALWIETPGVMVIRDDSTWRALWARHARTPVDSVPAMDFGREVVAAVSRGGLTGCGNAARYVWRVERARDTLFVVTTPDGYPDTGDGEVTCMMENAPVDLVALPRGGTVVFVGPSPRIHPPPPARWLGPDTLPAAPRVVGCAPPGSWADTLPPWLLPCEG